MKYDVWIYNWIFPGTFWEISLNQIKLRDLSLPHKSQIKLGILQVMHVQVRKHEDKFDDMKRAC